MGALLGRFSKCGIGFEKESLEFGCKIGDLLNLFGEIG